MTPAQLASVVVAAALTTSLKAQSCSDSRDLGPGDAYGVSASGTYVVGTHSPWIARAFLWSDALGKQDLGGLTPTSPSFGRGVSDDGSVVVGYSLDAASWWRAFRWTASGGMQDLGSLGNANSEAYAVSADGSAIVGQTQNLAGRERAFRWTAQAGMEQLGPLGAGAFDAAYGVSADGSVVVGVSNNRAFRWTVAGSMQDLGTLGGDYSRANGVSYDGSVVVGTSRNVSGEERAFRWTAAGGMQDLGALGINGSYAHGVSPEGDVVVGWSDGGYRWTALDGMRAIELHGITFANPRAVSSGGSIVVGEGRVNGSVYAYLWTFRPPMPFGTRYCSFAAIPNSTGCRGAMNLAGSPQVAANSLELIADQLPPFAFGFFLTSRDQGNTYPVNSSDGRLCLGGFIGRFVGPGQILNSGAAGSFMLAIDLASMPQPFGSVTVQPGDTWNFQAWHRDANPTLVSNFTDSVSVYFQ